VHIPGHVAMGPREPTTGEPDMDVAYVVFFPFHPEASGRQYVVRCPGCGGLYRLTVEPTCIGPHECPLCFTAFDRSPVHPAVAMSVTCSS
jgi:hypothetical protein